MWKLAPRKYLFIYFVWLVVLNQQAIAFKTEPPNREV